MPEIKQKETFEESVRKRLPMYIGNDGFNGIFEGLLLDCIQLCGTDQIVFEIVINEDNDFYIGFSSTYDLDQFLQQFTSEDQLSYCYLPRVLKVISEVFDLSINNNKKAEIKFSFDKTLSWNSDIDFIELSEKLIFVALLNRGIEIIITDKRQNYLRQNYYHFPDGIFYLFNRVVAKSLGNPEFKVKFDGEIKSNQYQIGIAYRTDWYPSPSITSFANDVQTICGGSMVDGILDGLMIACRAYLKRNETFKIKRKKLMNGLIVVCCVRGDKFKYGGSFKETLEDDEVRKQVGKITAQLVLDFFNNHKEKADNFLWRYN